MTFNSRQEQHFLDGSIIKCLKKHFYGDCVDSKAAYDSPVVKGFPWPSSTHRIVFIHIAFDENGKDYLNKQAELCCRIV